MFTRPSWPRMTFRPTSHGRERTLQMGAFATTPLEIGQTVLDMFRDAGIRLISEPSTLFAALIPQDVLLAHHNPPAVIPDAAVDIALPPAVTLRHARQVDTPEPRRRHLIDFKCIHAGGGPYLTPRAQGDQSGAVAHRAHLEWAAYQRAARDLDTRFHAPRTPIHDRLMSFGQLRCLTFGAYGEGSPDVHHCIHAAARQRATSSWRSLGARTHAEAYTIWVQTYRRDVGLAIVREHARLRLHRIPFIGVPRAALRARQGQRDRVVRGEWADGGRREDFFAVQGQDGMRRVHAP